MAASRFRSREKVFLLGKIRRTDWLPVGGDAREEQLLLSYLSDSDEDHGPWSSAFILHEWTRFWSCTRGNAARMSELLSWGITRQPPTALQHRSKSSQWLQELPMFCCFSACLASNHCQGQRQTLNGFRGHELPKRSGCSIATRHFFRRSRYDLTQFHTRR